MAAQEQAIRTSSIQHHIGKTEDTRICRPCAEREETLAYILSEFKTLA